MTIQWQDTMSIDGGVIDDDHRYLIGLVNELESVPPGAAMPSRVAAILARLEAYAHGHFEREEQLHSAVHAPAAEAHHFRHIALLCEVEANCNEWAMTRTPEETQQFYERLCAFMRHWVMDHIMKDDLLLISYIRAIRAQPDGIVPPDQPVAVSGVVSTA